MRPHLRLAIGDAYKVYLWEDGEFAEDVYYVFEICGEIFVDGKRLAIGVKQGVRSVDESQVVFFNSKGLGNLFNGKLVWKIWGKSRARRQYR